MPILNPETVARWNAAAPPGGWPLDKPESHGEADHRLREGEIPCPHCGSPAKPYTPWSNSDCAGVGGLYQCDPFVEGSCMKVFARTNPPFPECMACLIEACEKAACNEVNGGLDDPDAIRIVETSNAAYDALATVDGELARLRGEE